MFNRITIATAFRGRQNILHLPPQMRGPQSRIRKGSPYRGNRNNGDGLHFTKNSAVVRALSNFIYPENEAGRLLDLFRRVEGPLEV